MTIFTIRLSYRSRVSTSMAEQCSITLGAGYVVNNATSSCEYCAYRVGDQFYGPLGFEFDQRWLDLGIFACYIVSSTAILFVAVSCLRSVWQEDQY